MWRFDKRHRCCLKSDARYFASFQLHFDLKSKAISLFLLGFVLEWKKRGLKAALNMFIVMTFNIAELRQRRTEPEGQGSAH